MERICICILLVIAIITSICFLAVLSNINDWIKARALRETELLRKEKYGEDKPLLDKIITTDKFISMINAVIDEKVEERLELMSFLNQPYNISNLDKDVSNIASEIFNIFKKECYVDKDVIVNEQWILLYITNQVSIRFTSVMKKFNSELYIEKNNM